MSELLTAEALVALSVSKLETELKANTYTADVLNAAIELENAKDDTRSTAIEALEAAMPATSETETATSDDVVYVMAPRSCLTSKKGLLKPGQVVKPEYFVNGQATIDDHLKTGHIVIKAAK